MTEQMLPSRALRIAAAFAAAAISIALAVGVSAPPSSVHVTSAQRPPGAHWG